MSSPLKLVDAWVNPNIATESVDPVITGMFPGLRERRLRGTTLAQLVDEMDASGVERAVLCAGYRGADNLGWVEEAVSTYPGRFAGSLVLDPLAGMRSVRALESAVRNSGVRIARVMALETQLPYDSGVYYPLYAKCAELDIPIGVNVGIPGPPVPGKHQHPLPLDGVCHYFPELRVVMSHGGVPWEHLCVRLMQKWPNLFYMSSAYTPRRIPAEVIDYVNSSGADRVMWASDYPILDFARCRSEIEQLAFRDDDRRNKFAYGNALRMFFS